MRTGFLMGFRLLGQRLKVGKRFFNLSANGLGQADKGFGTHGVELPDRQDVFDLVLDPGKALQFDFMGGEDTILDSLQFYRAQGGDVGVKSAVPIDKGAFGDVELHRDGGEAEAFGSELDELVGGLVGVHGVR